MHIEHRNSTWTLMLLSLSGKHNSPISFDVLLKLLQSERNPSLSGVLCSAWKVEYHQQRVCAVKGSSVVILCSFYHPDNLSARKVMWGHVKPHRLKGRFISDSDVRKVTTRFQYIGDKRHNCSLKIHQVERNDAGKYTVRLNNKISRRPGNVSPTLKVVGKFFFSFS